MSVIPLNEKSDEYKSIIEYIGNTNLNIIVAIDKIIIHPNMEKSFNNRKSIIEKNRGECSVKRLFHGTSEVSIQSIINEGFDLDRCNTCLYGKGVYFGTSINVSNYYSKNTTKHCVRYMFICDVLVGRCKVGTNNEILDTANYDNFVNAINNPKMYITTYMDGILPKYVVSTIKEKNEF